jgi:hypothetical protein
MIISRSQRLGLTIAEVWFDEDPGDARFDILRHRQSLVPLRQGTCVEFYTITVDLRQAEQDLLQQVSKENRYEIRRASERDGLKLHVWDARSGDEIKRFLAFYNEFAATKQLAQLGLSGLELLWKAQCLGISRAEDLQGDTLVYHAYYAGRNRVRLLHSASLFRASGDSSFRSLVGRANRWLHWEDFRRFKAEGKATYDFGGWYQGRTNAELLRINTFKEGFGGKVERNYNGEKLITVRAKVAKRMHLLIEHLRRPGGSAFKH